MLEADMNSYLSKKQSLETRLSNIGSEIKLDSLVLDQIDKEPKIADYTKQIEHFQKNLDYDLKALNAKPDHPVVVQKRQKLAEVTEARNELRNKKIS